MLAVNFLIHDNSKAAVILSLLKELPFVEVSSCQESDKALLSHYQQLLVAHLHYPNQSATVKIQNSPGVNVCHSFDNKVKSFPDSKMKPYYNKLRAACTSVEATRFAWQDEVAYCLILDQYRFLYRLSGETIWIFDIHDLSSAG